jgi:hypothetical protein
MLSMIVRGQLLWTDYLDSQLLHLRPDGLARYIAYGAVVLFGLGTLGCLVFAILAQAGFQLLILPLFVAAFIALYRYVLLPNRVRKIFSQQKELGAAFELEISESGLRASNEFGNSIRPWGNFTKWKENSSLLLLYHSDMMFSVLPKRCFPEADQAETIKSYLLQNGVPAANSRPLLQGLSVSCVVYIVLLVLMFAIFYISYSSSVR